MIYFNIRVRKEGYTQEMLAADMGRLDNDQYVEMSEPKEAEMGTTKDTPKPGTELV